jgi:protein ImuB
MEGKQLRVVTAAAARMRVRAGMAASEARALCANLGIFEWDNAVIDAAITGTTASLLAASPQVTPVAGAPGTWWLGAGGMDALGGDGELARLLHAITSNWHPHSRIGIADSCVAARAATWSAAARRHAKVIVPRGECAAYLANVPLPLIPMEEELRDTLQALGITSAGAFAALEPEDVERRWGANGLLAWQLSRGEDRRRPVLARAAVERSVSVELATSAETVEPLIFMVNAALTRLVAALVSDARAAAAVAITLVLDDGRGALPSGGIPHTITREVRPARPLARVAPLRELCRTLLERWTLSAPVCGVTVSITATAPSSAEQGNLLDTEWKDPAAAEAALDRLRAELGAGSVVQPVANDTHRPEQAGAWVAMDDIGRGGNVDRDEAVGGHAGGDGNPDVNGDAADLAAVADGGARSNRATLRLLDPAECASVECEDKVPRVVRWRSRVIRISRAVGPERLSGDWWKDDYRRDYWRCEEENERVDLVLYRDRARGEWFVQGWWD